METHGSLEVEVRPTQRTRGGTKRAYRGRVATARKKPARIIYMILCTVNQRRYYGEGIGKNRRSNHRLTAYDGTNGLWKTTPMTIRQSSSTQAGRPRSKFPTE